MSRRFLVLALLSLWSAGAAWADSVAILTATFDPPTQARLRIVRCALGDPTLPKECGELGKSITRLYVLVREDPGGDTLASARERTLMVSRALKQHGDRVRVLSADSHETVELKRRLLADPTVERLYELAAADSQEAAPAAVVAGSAKWVSVVFPLEREGGAAEPGKRWDHAVAGDVKAVMDKLGLYRQVSADLAPLQRALFKEGWEDFLDDLRLACPFTIQRDACNDLSAHWKSIAIEMNGGSATPANATLLFKPAQSEDRWAEKFVNTALRPLDGNEGYDKLKTVAEDIAARTLRGYPRGKVPHLKRITIPRHPATRDPLKAVSLPVDCSAPEGTYNMNIDQYTADRFPRAFARFLKQDYRKHSRQPVELFVHNNNIEEAYEFHRRMGFETFYFVQTRRGQLHRDIHLAIKSSPRTYRVVLTSVRGNDRRANVLCQIHRAGVFAKYRFVESPREEPLFVLNAEGSQLKLHKNDWLLFGFRGTWRRKLQAEQWHRTSLIQEGLDIDLFTRPGTPHKLVTVRNVFGDDANIILNTFYARGARQFIYLGSAGAIQNYRVGDLVIPSEFVDRRHSAVSFSGNLGLLYEKELAALLPVHAHTKHAWAQHLYEETIGVLTDWRNHSVGAVDIEGLYLGKFAQQHKDLKMGAFFVISDQTLGKNTIEDSNAYRGVIDASVDKIVRFLMPRVTTSP